MQLDKPAFPFLFSPEKVATLAIALATSRGWKNATVSGPKLICTPYWLFNFDSYSEEGEGGKVSALRSGALALNASTGELEDLGKIHTEHSAPVQEIPEEFSPSVELQRAKILEGDAKELALLKVAAKLHVPRSRVSISGIEFFYVPFWLAGLSLGGKQMYTLRVNATTGEIYGAGKVLERGRNTLEIVNETLNELRSPQAWVKYTVALGKSITSGISKPIAAVAMPEHSESVKVAGVLLAIVAFIAIVWALGYI